MLPTIIWNTLGRCCSSNDAVLPTSMASSYSSRASSRSRIVASITRPPMVMVMAWTAARVDAGKRYIASRVRSPSLR